jgi:PAS domain-containing protein
MSLPSLSPTRDDEEGRDVPVERDLLRKLLEPKVISPRAVRPVGSTIHIDSVVVHAAGSADVAASCAAAAAASKTAEEVEAELEADALPAVVSDSSNRVRLVNDAYKEMVGAPECPWLGAVASAAPSRRISGEVALQLVPEQQAALPEAFSCTAKIEWERGGERASIHAACDVSRLHCDSRDYIFVWRFRTADASSVSS